MQIITLNENEFYEFAKSHKYESFYQTPDYAELEKRDKYKIHYLGFKKNDGTLFGASMMLYKTLFWNYKYAYAPRGMLIDYDDEYTVSSVTNSLKLLLKKQNFIFIKIDPPIIATERDNNGKIIYFSNTVNNILNSLRKNDYEHLGFNLYFESSLPRWNAFVKLLPNGNDIFNSFTMETKSNIKSANKKGVKIIENNNIDFLWNFLWENKLSKKKVYFENLVKCFEKNSKIKIFYSMIDTNLYSVNINELYNQELEVNNGLTNIIENNNNAKYDIQKVISDKIESDKILSEYKKDIVLSTKLLHNYPNGLICSVAIMIEQEKGVNVYASYDLPGYENFHINDVMIYELMKKYAKMHYKYINIGPITGNFNPKGKYYNLLQNKMGFNPSIIEYIGEFNLIINPLMYKIYKHKYNIKTLPAKK